MDKKTKGIIATVTSALLCGCPGACVILFGAISAAGFGTSEFNGSTSSISSGYGYAVLCFGIIMLLIPIVVAVLSFMPKKNKDEDLIDEEIPPAI